MPRRGAAVLLVYAARLNLLRRRRGERRRARRRHGAREAPRLPRRVAPDGRRRRLRRHHRIRRACSCRTRCAPSRATTSAASSRSRALARRGAARRRGRAVARRSFAPAELPIGAVTAAVGAPLFAWMLLRETDANAGTPRLETRGLARRVYGRTEALLGLDAAIPRRRRSSRSSGENGSGKSTLLKVVARIVPRRRRRGPARRRAPARAARGARPRAASPTCRRASISSFRSARLDLVLQGRAPHAARLLGRFRPRTARARSTRCGRATSQDLAERDASALSGGETRRVFLARAAGPGGRDLAPRRADGRARPAPPPGVSRRPAADARERGATVLLVTHEVDLAARTRGPRPASRGTAARSRPGPPAEVLTRGESPRRLRRRVPAGRRRGWKPPPCPSDRRWRRKPAVPAGCGRRSLAFALPMPGSERSASPKNRASRGIAVEQGPRRPLGQVRQLPADPLQQGARAELQDLPQVRLPLPALGRRAPANALRRRAVHRSSRRSCVRPTRCASATRSATATA